MIRVKQTGAFLPLLGSKPTVARNPLARALPPCVVLPLAHVHGLAPALTLLFDETERGRCGQRLLAERLFEVVLIQLLRWLRYVEMDGRPG